jgi:hypothetical protein
MKTTQQSNKDELICQPWARVFIDKELRNGTPILVIDRCLSRQAKVLGLDYMSCEEALAKASILCSAYLYIDTVVNSEQSELTLVVDDTVHLHKNTRSIPKGL